jgi:hypothetical protein
MTVSLLNRAAIFTLTASVLRRTFVVGRVAAFFRSFRQLAYLCGRDERRRGHAQESFSRLLAKKLIVRYSENWYGITMLTLLVCARGTGGREDEMILANDNTPRNGSGSSSGKKFLAGVSLLVLSLMPLYAIGNINEVWVSAQGRQLATGFILGSGAITNPFYGDFEAIINSLQPNTVIHLLPGTFVSVEVGLKGNQKLKGAGRDVTIVKRGRKEDTQVDGFIWSREDGIEVSDLTVDSNATGSELKKKNAIYLIGSHCAVRRVKAIHNVGSYAGSQECFPFFIGWTNSVANEISECEVSSVLGDYCTAIELLGQGIVKFNHVFLPPFTNVNSIYTGYQASGTTDATFMGNTSEGGLYGFETDTASETNLTLLDNWFHNVFQGIVVRKGPMTGWGIDGLLIEGNIIELSTNVPVWQGNWSQGVQIDNGDTSRRNVYQRMAVLGNTIRYVNNGHIGTQAGTVGIAIVAEFPDWCTVSNVRVTGNTMDRSFLTRLNGQGNWMADNFDLAGVPLSFVTLGAGSLTNAALGITDSLVWVTATNTVSLALPPSAGFPGKEVTIVDKKPTTLVIRAAVGERILAYRSVVLSQNGTAKFVSNGAGVWVKE